MLTQERDEIAAALAAEKMKLAQEQHRGDGLGARIAALETERADRIAVLDRRVVEIRDRETELAVERTRIEVLTTEVARLEAERSDRLAELSRYAADIERFKIEVAQAAAERRARAQQLQALEESAAADRRVLEERVAAMGESATAAKAEAMSLMIRAEADLMNSGDNTRNAITELEAEKAELAARFSSLEDDFALLRAENAELRRVSGAEWENERLENSRLRERLAAIAADVVRQTQANRAAPHATEEGNGAGNGNGVARKPAPATSVRPVRPPAEVTPVGEASPAGKTLAERIRALQHSAARH